MSALAKPRGPVAEALWRVDLEFGDVTLEACVEPVRRGEARLELVADDAQEDHEPA